MSDGAKLFLGMLLLPIIVVAAFVGLQITYYVPSGLMAEAAAKENYSVDAREKMAWLLRSCRKRGRWHFKAAEIGVKYHSLTSWRNDAGWLARTEIRCVDGQACSVEGRALIAAPRQSTPCGWGQRKRGDRLD